MQFRQSVTSIINDVIRELDLHANATLKLSGYAIDFLRELNNDTKPLLKSMRWDSIPPSRIIPFPLDYVSYVVVASQYQEGLKPLAYNYQMAQGVDMDNVPNMRSAQQLNGLYGNVGLPYAYANGYGFGTGTGRVQAFGNGNNLGYFSEDKVQKVFRLDPDRHIPNFYVLYLSDCMEVNDDMIVDPRCIAAMKVYMKLNWYKDKKDPYWQSYQGDLIVETKEMRNRFFNMSEASIVNLVEQTWGGQE
jgi:hypothetical protein